MLILQTSTNRRRTNNRRSQLTRLIVPITSNRLLTLRTHSIRLKQRSRITRHHKIYNTNTNHNLTRRPRHSPNLMVLLTRKTHNRLLRPILRLNHTPNLRHKIPNTQRRPNQPTGKTQIPNLVKRMTNGSPHLINNSRSIMIKHTLNGSQRLNLRLRVTQVNTPNTTNILRRTLLSGLNTRLNHNTTVNINRNTVLKVTTNRRGPTQPFLPRRRLHRHINRRHVTKNNVSSINPTIPPTRNIITNTNVRSRHTITHPIN